MPRRKKKDLTFEDLRVKRWVLNRRGILTQVAVACHVTEQFVHQIAYGRSSALPGHCVEQELYKEGWPGHKWEREEK